MARASSCSPPDAESRGSTLPTSGKARRPRVSATSRTPVRLHWGRESCPELLAELGRRLAELVNQLLLLIEDSITIRGAQGTKSRRVDQSTRVRARPARSGGRHRNGATVGNVAPLGLRSRARLLHRAADHSSTAACVAPFRSNPTRISTRRVCVGIAEKRMQTRLRR